MVGVLGAAFSVAPSTYAAELPELQVGTRIVSVEAAAMPAASSDEAASEPVDQEADEAAS